MTRPFASIRCRSRLRRLTPSDARLQPPACRPQLRLARGRLEVFAPVVADNCDMEVQAACLWARLALVEVVANEMHRPHQRPPTRASLEVAGRGRWGGAGMTGRPWPGSLPTIRGAAGSLKHVQPAFISVLGVNPSAVAALTTPSVI